MILQKAPSKNNSKTVILTTDNCIHFIHKLINLTFIISAFWKAWRSNVITAVICNYLAIAFLQEEMQKFFISIVLTKLKVRWKQRPLKITPHWRHHVQQLKEADGDSFTSEYSTGIKLLTCVSNIATKATLCVEEDEETPPDFNKTSYKSQT